MSDECTETSNCRLEKNIKNKNMGCSEGQYIYFGGWGVAVAKDGGTEKFTRI